MSFHVPLMRSVTLPSSASRYNLHTLLIALDASIPKRAQMVQVQLDIGASAAQLFVGNADTVSATDCGAVLVASQAFSIQSVESNLIMLTDIGLASDTDNVQINVVVVTR